MKFELAEFIFKIEPEEELHLPPFKGSAIRGGFGYAFRKATCVTKKQDCHECILKAKCVYSYVFETPIPPDTKIMRKYTSAPHPFVFEPPIDGKEVYEKGEELSFGLTLFGKAIDYLPYFIYAFDELGQMGLGTGRGKFQIKDIFDLELNGKKNQIYDGEKKILKNKSHPSVFLISPEETKEVLKPCSNITLQFLTPTRLKSDGKLTLDIDFTTLFRNLLRRISLLSYFHCGEELNLNYRDLIEQSESVKVTERRLKWYDWERYSSRQKTTMKLGGFTGVVAFKGDLTRFLPYLQLGEHIHLGKNTGFGLGKYKIV